ncbi:MAG TPA: hypothetical protein PLA03_08035 [Acidobacteriota bacterium]|nr:hypothetical protein [Acidobacteriota bacterium]
MAKKSVVTVSLKKQKRWELLQESRDSFALVAEGVFAAIISLQGVVRRSGRITIKTDQHYQAFQGNTIAL